MTTIGELERAAGITDRAAFWGQFQNIRGSAIVSGRQRDARAVAAVAELERRIAAQVKTTAVKRRAAK